MTFGYLDVDEPLESALRAFLYWRNRRSPETWTAHACTTGDSTGGAWGEILLGSSLNSVTGTDRRLTFESIADYYNPLPEEDSNGVYDIDESKRPVVDPLRSRRSGHIVTGMGLSRIARSELYSITGRRIPGNRQRGGGLVLARDVNEMGRVVVRKTIRRQQ